MIKKNLVARLTRSILPILVLSLIGLTTLPHRASADTATWDFEYPANALRDGAVLDLRYLNEKSAGQDGFITRSRDGNSFLTGAGQPIRFWAVNAGSDMPAEDLGRQARFLAKMGVNMIRLHTQLAPDKPDQPITAFSQKTIDGIWRAIAANKKEGIYTTISPYWANAKHAKKWGIAGYESDGADLWGVLFFNEQLQTGYKAWVRQLYTTPNPYTGIPLAKDPAVAIIQVQNEDSLFFWTLQGLKTPQKEILGKKFGDWLAKKYGSLEKAKAAWQNSAAPADNIPAGIADILQTWEMIKPQPGGKGQRLSDQTAFLAELQRGFYADMGDYYHKDLGCRQLIDASNWITANAVTLGDLERYTYTANEVLAVNRYYSGAHIGPQTGWRIDPNDFFTDVSATLNVRELPTNLKQVVGHPMMITESSWVPPMGYQAEGPFLIAAYQSLTGVDAYYWFAITKPEYDTAVHIPFLNMNGQHPMFKWSASTPSIVGNFPANALAFRRGYIKQGQPVIHEERALDDMYARKNPLIAEDPTFDPNRNPGVAAGRSELEKGVNPLAFLVGPVEVSFSAKPGPSRVADLSQFIDEKSKTIRSNTNEITMNYDTGLCTLNAPKAQGVCGFLKKAGGKFTLADATIETTNDYAAISIVSMDDQPLSQSQKILVQIGTVVRPKGFTTKTAKRKADNKTYTGQEITNTGSMPWQSVTTDATLTLRNPTLHKATPLDPAGFPLKEIPATTAPGAFQVKLPENRMYIVLE
jgi:hypothetical protein